MNRPTRRPFSQEEAEQVKAFAEALQALLPDGCQFPITIEEDSVQLRYDDHDLGILDAIPMRFHVHRPIRQGLARRVARDVTSRAIDGWFIYAFQMSGGLVPEVDEVNTARCTTITDAAYQLVTEPVLFPLRQMVDGEMERLATLADVEQF